MEQRDTIKFCKEENNSFFTIPFLPQLTDKFNNIVRDIGTIVSYLSLNKLNKHIKVHKDKIPKYSNTHVVQKIKCNDCDASYVGQTCRKLNTRIKEHRQHIIRNTNTKSVIIDHRINLNHDFNWNETEILDIEPYYNKRMVSEMLHIKKQYNSLNLQTDTEYLPDIYNNIIKKLSAPPRRY